MKFESLVVPVLGLVVLAAAGAQLLSHYYPNIVPVERDEITAHIAVEWPDCGFEMSDAWPEIDCGLLEVPEDHLNPGIAKVRLPFLIIRGGGSASKKYPLVMTGGGGPGNSVGIGEDMTPRKALGILGLSRLASVRSGRDMILMDNRGVGSSEPRLQCPEIESLKLTEMSKQAYVASQRDAYASCRDRLVKELGVDISKYNVLQAAHDVDALRRALELEVINVYGVSYGARVAMTFAREFPQSARSLILDSPIPPHIRQYEEAPKSDSEMIGRLFAMCELNAECRRKFGADLWERFDAFVQTLDAKTFDVAPSLVDQSGGPARAALVVNTVFKLMYEAQAYYELPYLISEMLAGRPGLFQNLLYSDNSSRSPGESIDYGAYASYMCHDEFPFNDMDRARSETERYPVQMHMNRLFNEVAVAMCEVWDVPLGDPIEARPFVSSVPTLIYSGELDPVAPAQWAAQIAENLDSTSHVVWLRVGHGVLASSECAERIAERFLVQPEQDPTRGMDCARRAPKFYRFRID